MLDKYKTNYPNVVHKVGEEWLASQLKKPKGKRSCLVAFLEQAYDCSERIKTRNEFTTYEEKNVSNEEIVRELFSPPIEQADLLERCLKELNSAKGVDTLIKELKGPEDKFYSALTVANLACYFKERGKMELYPKIQMSNRTKYLDLTVKLAGRTIWVEATTPRVAKVIDQNPDQGVEIKNRALGQIVDELRENFEPAIKENKITDDPILIVVDCQRCEIDSYDIETALFRTKHVESNVNRGNHLLSHTSILRGEPGIRSVEHSEMISAVLYIKRAKMECGRIVIYGKLIQNPYSKNPLHNEEISKIEIVQCD